MDTVRRFPPILSLSLCSHRDRAPARRGRTRTQVHYHEMSIKLVVCIMFQQTLLSRATVYQPRCGRRGQW